MQPRCPPHVTSVVTAILGIARRTDSGLLCMMMLAGFRAALGKRA